MSALEVKKNAFWKKPDSVPGTTLVAACVPPSVPFMGNLGAGCETHRPPYLISLITLALAKTVIRNLKPRLLGPYQGALRQPLEDQLEREAICPIIAGDRTDSGVHRAFMPSGWLNGYELFPYFCYSVNPIGLVDGRNDPSENSVHIAVKDLSLKVMLIFNGVARDPKFDRGLGVVGPPRRHASEIEASIRARKDKNVGIVSIAP